MKQNELNAAWWKAVGIRSLHTMAQVALGFLTVGAAISDVNWGLMLSTSLVAGAYSVVKSLAVGIPEVPDESTRDKDETP